MKCKCWYCKNAHPAYASARVVAKYPIRRLGIEDEFLLGIVVPCGVDPLEFIRERARVLGEELSEMDLFRKIEAL